MTLSVTWTAAAAAAAALSACAGGAPRPMASGAPHQCFYAQNINGFAAVDERAVNIRVGVNDYYRLDLLGPCPDIDWAIEVVIQSRGTSWICSGLDAMVIAPSAIGPTRCPVRTITKLTPPQVAALPAAQKP